MVWSVQGRRSGVLCYCSLYPPEMAVFLRDQNTSSIDFETAKKHWPTRLGVSSTPLCLVEGALWINQGVSSFPEVELRPQLECNWSVVPFSLMFLCPFSHDGQYQVYMKVELKSYPQSSQSVSQLLGHSCGSGCLWILTQKLRSQE